MACRQQLDFPMMDAPELGTELPCPIPGCGGRIKRVLSMPAGFIIKGEHLPDWRPGEMMTARVGGNDVNFEFVDHPHTDPQAQAKMQRLAAMQGVTQRGRGIGQAYYNEKFGRFCVDVASNQEDPLGTINRAAARGETVATKVPVNAPYRTRKLPKPKKVA